jgi:TolB-like protein/Tfp pilus assembly protein PilF
LSPDPNDAFVAASIHEEILNQVAKLSSLLVVARTSVMQYEKARPSVPQIARELSATAVMECSVRYAGDDILVTAQLIDPETDSHLWSDTYPGSLSDVSAIFAMQADIAMSIANALDAEFSQAEQARIEKVPTTSAEAYSLYLRARDISRTTQPDGAQGIRLLEEAIRVDSQFALAHAVLAGNLTFGLINGLSDATGDWREVESRAIEHAERALRLDPDIGLAYDALGLLYRHTWRWPEALEAFESALELSPNDPIILADFGWLNSFRGAHRESLRMAERRLELEPGVASAYSSLGFTHAAMGNVEAAASAHRQALLLNPTEFPARQHLGVMQALLGNGGAAEAEFRTLEGQFGGKLPLVLLPELAMGYSMIGLDDDARRLVDEILSIAEQREVGAGTVAMAYLAVGERDKAIAQLQIAVDRAERREPDGGFFSLMIIKNNVIQNAILEEPQFRDLRARLGST